jgi:hypothetical protein
MHNLAFESLTRERSWYAQKRCVDHSPELDAHACLRAVATPQKKSGPTSALRGSAEAGHAHVANAGGALDAIF